MFKLPNEQRPVRTQSVERTEPRYRLVHRSNRSVRRFLPNSAATPLSGGWIIRTSASQVAMLSNEYPGSVFYYVRDHLGSVVALAQDGVLVETYEYEPFGRPMDFGYPPVAWSYTGGLVVSVHPPAEVA